MTPRELDTLATILSDVADGRLIANVKSRPLTLLDDWLPVAGDVVIDGIVLRAPEQRESA